MASASPPVDTEADKDIVVLDSESTESTSTTTQLPSLLDRLRPPTKSDLCGKRKVQSLKSTAVINAINQVLQTLQIPKVLLLTQE